MYNMLIIMLSREDIKLNCVRLVGRKYSDATRTYLSALFLFPFINSKIKVTRGGATTIALYWFKQIAYASEPTMWALSMLILQVRVVIGH
jgi:hypothetical protein